MKKYNIYFKHVKDMDIEKISNIEAKSKKEATIIARNETAYLDPYAHKIERVEKI